MTMKMLEAGGVDLITDGIRTADEDNPKGYYEDERVKNLHEMEDKSWLKALRGKGIKIISFLLKDLPRNNNYRVLFMHRNVQEVLASQSKMLTRRNETSETDDQQMLGLYENHLWRVKYLLNHSSHFETLGIHYKEALEKPLEGAKRINNFLGGNLNTEAMAGVVDKQLYRNRR